MQNTQFCMIGFMDCYVSYDYYNESYYKHGIGKTTFVINSIYPYSLILKML